MCILAVTRTLRQEFQVYYVSTFDETDYQIDLELVDRINRRRIGRHEFAVPDLIAGRLFERLALLKINPQRVLDLGAGDARHIKPLQKSFPDATVFAADLSASQLRSARATRFWQRQPPLVALDASSLAFADGVFDLVVSNLMLPWIHPPDQFASELNRVMSEQGVFFLSTAGPDTLIELRECWASIDSASHVNALLDMHDVGDLLLRSGVSDPVMDVERLQINYSSVDALLDELIATGALSVVAGRRRGLMGRDIRRKLASAYPKNNEGGITATLEVVYAHGWKGQSDSSRKHSSNGEVYVSLDSLRGFKK